MARRGRRCAAPDGNPAQLITFNRLKWASLSHSCIYLALLYAAFVAGKPEPATFVLGLAHGLLWIGMSLACLWAVRARIVPLRVAVAVAVLGGLGPFVGSLEFLRESRRGAGRTGPDPSRGAPLRDGGGDPGPTG